MILPEEQTTSVVGVSLNVYSLVYRADFPKVASFEKNGGDDETRTRDLCRDRAAL
jgi:hypothetical protein